MYDIVSLLDVLNTNNSSFVSSTRAMTRATPSSYKPLRMFYRFRIYLAKIGYFITLDYSIFIEF